MIKRKKNIKIKRGKRKKKRREGGILSDTKKVIIKKHFFLIPTSETRLTHIISKLMAFVRPYFCDEKQNYV